MKTGNNKIPVSSVFNGSEGLYGTTVRRFVLSVGLIISRGECVSGHVVQASSPPKCLDRNCMGRRRTGTRHGNVYRSVREKQGDVVYRQRVLQTATSLRLVSLVFRGHDLLKIANINP